MSTEDERTQSVRDSALIAATETFVQSLKALGVESYVLGYGLSEHPEGDGAVRFEGNPGILINLIAGLIRNMRAEDFHCLLHAMLQGDYFAAQRGKSVVVEKVKATGVPQKTEWMN